MKTIEVNIDDRLLRVVDQLARARKTTRSALIRDAIGAEIRRDLEARHAEGYIRKPVEAGEFDGWP